jgi:hypothetical protein
MRCDPHSARPSVQLESWVTHLPRASELTIENHSDLEAPHRPCHHAGPRHMRNGTLLDTISGPESFSGNASTKPLRRVERNIGYGNDAKRGRQGVKLTSGSAYGGQGGTRPPFKGIQAMLMEHQQWDTNLTSTAELLWSSNLKSWQRCLASSCTPTRSFKWEKDLVQIP